MKRRDIIVYLSAPIRGPDAAAESANCLAAADKANQLVNAGYTVVCVHCGYDTLRRIGAQHGPWLESDCALVRACDVVYMLGDTISDGMRLELDAARTSGTPCVSSDAELEAVYARWAEFEGVCPELDEWQPDCDGSPGQVLRGN